MELTKNHLHKQLNNYFPNNVLPLDPWLGFEMLDKVFKPLDDKENQKRILKDFSKNHLEMTTNHYSNLLTKDTNY